MANDVQKHNISTIQKLFQVTVNMRERHSGDWVGYYAKTDSKCSFKDAQRAQKTYYKAILSFKRSFSTISSRRANSSVMSQLQLTYLPASQSFL